MFSLVALVCTLGAGGAAVVNVAKSHAVTGTVAACESLISTGQELLDQGKSDDALAAFEAALRKLSAGWGATLLTASGRDSLRCRISIGAARALLLSGQRLPDAHQYAERATEAAKCCAAADQLLLLSAAQRTLLDVLLAQSAECARAAHWALALDKAERATALVATAEEQARARTVREVARRGLVGELIESADVGLQRRDWQFAEEMADAALRMVEEPDERAQAEQRRHAAKQGAFEALLAPARTHLHQQRFAEAERAALAAHRATFDAASKAQAAAVLADARRGLFLAALAEADAATLARRWDAARRAVERARGFAADDGDRATAEARRAAARVGEFNYLVTKADAALQQRTWQVANNHAKAALKMAVDAAERAAAQARRAAARVGEFNELVTKAEAALQQRTFLKVVEHSDAALRLAADAAERARAEQLCRSGHQGIFDPVLARAQAHLQARRFAEAEREAQAAQRVAFDAATRAQAAAALGTARRGQFQAAIDKCAAAAAQRLWDAAIDAAERALKHAATAEERRIADERWAAARASKCDALLAQAAAHLAAGRWEDSEGSARDAYDCADDDDRIERASIALEAVGEAQDAAEEAEPEYVEAVDDFIRRRPDFSGNAPLQYECKIALITKHCRKPAAIPHDVAVVLRRHPDMFTLVKGGAAVRLTRLTPWRGTESHRVFGEFRCRCGKRWSSASTFCDNKQACKGCNTWSYPYAQRPLDRRADSEDEADAADERRPHDMERCERCRQLGRCCVPSSEAASGRSYTASRRGAQGRGRGRGRGGQMPAYANDYDDDYDPYEWD